MDLLTEVEFQSQHFPEAAFRLRRISLAQRLRFIAANFELMRQMRFRDAQGSASAEAKVAQAEAEIELSRRILDATLVGIRGIETPPENLAEWLLREAPNELCVEVLRHAGEEMILGETKRKK